MKALAVLLFISMMGPAISHAAGIAPEAMQAEVTLVVSDAERIVLDCRLGGFTREAVELGGETYYNIALRGEAVLAEQGAPSLPRITRHVIIPDAAQMELRILESQYIQSTMPVTPSRGAIPRHEDPAQIPHQFGETYDQDVLYPATVAELGIPYIMRDFRGVAVNFYPIRYNPQTRLLSICTHLVVELRRSGPAQMNPKLQASRGANRFFDSIYAHHFLNYLDARYEPIDERGRLIVICHADFMSAVQPYVDWKRQKGIQTDLYDMATIGSSPEDIWDFVTDQYCAADGLTFVQLVGDSDRIPTFLTDIIFFGIHGVSDATYALVEGVDTYPEIFVGRFSAETTAQLATQIERTIHYERDIASGDWLHCGAGLGTVWGEGYGYHGWNGVQSLEVIRQDLIAYNYTEVAQLYEQGTPPFNIIPVDPAEVTQVLHDGIGILNVDGNADVTYLDTGGYTIAHVNALENDNQLPFIHLAAPYCGNFQYNCFAETWLRATNGATGAPTGAIAVYTCSNALQYAPPQAAMHEMIDLLIADEKITFGGLMYNGACWMMDLYGAPDEYDTFRNFNILGDASLQVRTDTPQAMAISHAASIPVGQSEFLVSTGTPDALVCLSEANTIVAADYTDPDGNVLLLFEPFAQPTELILTVSAYNKITSIETVPVEGSSSVAAGKLLWGTGIVEVDPNPFILGTTMRYSLSHEAQVVLEIYNLRGQRIRTICASDQTAGLHALVWDGRDASQRLVPSGAYFMRFKAGGAAVTRRVIRVR